MSVVKPQDEWGWEFEKEMYVLNMSIDLIFGAIHTLISLEQSYQVVINASIF